MTTKTIEEIHVETEAEWIAANGASYVDAVGKLAALRAQVQTITAERDDMRDWVRRITAEQRTLTCVYCGHAYPPGTPAHGSPVLTAHIAACEKHPLRIVTAERDDMRIRRDASQEEADNIRANRDEWKAIAATCIVTEREACAAACEANANRFAWDGENSDLYNAHMADARDIRARGKL